MRIAILADIHGNLPALEAIVQDLQRHRPDAVYLAGDQINRCPWNNEVMALIHDQKWPAIYGNHELSHPLVDKRKSRQTLFGRVARIARRKPSDVRQCSIYLCNARTAGKYVSRFFPESTDDSLEEALEGVAEPVVVTAHTHHLMFVQSHAFDRTHGLWSTGEVLVCHIITIRVHNIYCSILWRISGNQHSVKLNMIGVCRAQHSNHPACWLRLVRAPNYACVRLSLANLGRVILDTGIECNIMQNSSCPFFFNCRFVQEPFLVSS